MMSGGDDESTQPIVWVELRSQRDLLIEMRTMLASLSHARDDHETRLRKLEERRFPLQIVAVLLSTIAAIATVVGLLLTNL